MAEFRDWQVIARYSDQGVSGAKARLERPRLDAMLRDAEKAKFDVVMCWSLDRLGRSLIDLLQTVDFLNDTATTEIYTLSLHDTTTAAGKLLFHITGAFAE